MLCFPSVGGSGILGTSLALALAEKGHDIHVLSYQRPVRLTAGLANLTFHPVKLTEHGALPSADYVLALAGTLAQLCDRHEVDIIHAHYAFPHASAAQLALEMISARKPALVTTLHGTDVTELGRDPVLKRVVESALSRSDAVTAVSDHLCGQANAVFSLPRPVQRIYNFCEALDFRDRRDDTRRELQVGPEETLALHMSNLRPVKRFDLVLQAFARSRVEKLLVLNGGDVTPYQKLAQDLDLGERLIYQQTHQVADFVEACDLGLYASDEESFGLGILETMLGGKPVVATAVGGVPEVVAATGLLSAAGDAVALSRHLDTLWRDPEQRRQLGAQAQGRVRDHFSLEQALTDYLSLYRRVLSSALVG